MPRVFFNQKFSAFTPASGLGKGGLGFSVCADLLSILVAALLGGHRAESLHGEQTDRQTTSLQES